jgi:hypothetical protein
MLLDRFQLTGDSLLEFRREFQSRMSLRVNVVVLEAFS